MTIYQAGNVKVENKYDVVYRADHGDAYVSIPGLRANEPVFVFRGQDWLASKALGAYINALETNDLHDQALEVRVIARAMKEYAKGNGKLPD